MYLSCLSKRRGGIVSHLETHQRRFHSSRLSGSSRGKRDTWWEVYGKKLGGEGQRDQRLREKRCEGKKTLRLQPQPLCHLVSLNRLSPGLRDRWEDKQRLRRLTKALGGRVEGRHKQILVQAFQSLEGRRVLVTPSVMAREGKMQVGVGQPWMEWWEEEGRHSSCGRCLPLINRQCSVPDWPSQSLTFQNESVSLSISGCLFTGPEGRIWLEHRGPLNSWIWPKIYPKCSVLCSCPWQY